MTRRWQRYALAAVPVAMLTVGIPFANRVEPRVLGLPFLLAWIIAWIEGERLVADGGHRRGVVGLDVEAQQRLGVRRAHVEPGSARQGDRQPVEFVGRDSAPGERGTDRGDAAGLVVDGRVDLTRRAVPGELRGELGERPRLSAEFGEHVQGREQAGVGEPEVAEVVVRRVLATEDRIDARHLALDVGVADAGADRHPAPLAHDLGHRARRDQVVDHRAAGRDGEFPRGDQRGDRAGRDRGAVGIDEEAPVGVTVEGDTDVRTGGDDGALQIDQVRRLERVGLVIGGTSRRARSTTPRRSAGAPATPRRRAPQAR